MSISQRMSSSDNSLNFPSTATPALLNSIVARPCWASTSSANAFIRASSATFTICRVTFPFGEPSSATVPASPFSSTSEIASEAPSPASCCARHRPIPEPAPVITATPSFRNPMNTPSALDSQPSCSKISCAWELSPVTHYYHNYQEAASVGVTRGMFALREGVAHAHRIAPAAFRFIQHLVGLAYQRAKLRHLFAGATRDPKARAHINALPLKR